MMQAMSTRAIMIDEADGSFHYMGDSQPAVVSVGVSGHQEFGTQATLF